MSVEVLENTARQELEQQMEVNTVLLLRELHETKDRPLRQRLFEQAADQEASLISEVLDGSVITDFKFETQDGKLYLLQPNGVTDWQRMHWHGVLRARAKAAKDVGFSPYVGMAEAELEESRVQEEMVKAGHPAAMAKLSLCGDDVMSPDRLEKLARDPDKQRAYLRVSVFDGKEMHIHSRSIDGLSLIDGRGIDTGWGLWEEPQMDLEAGASSVGILKNRLYFDQNQMNVAQMHQLADRLVGAFDALQTSRTGKIYKAGRSPEGVDTYDFVLRNEDLLTAHMTSLTDLAARRNLPIGHLAALTNDLRYDIMSSFKQRLEGTWIERGSLGESVAAAGDIERTAGTQYGGCDTVIGTHTAERAGYINGSAHRAYELNVNCVKCPACKKIVDLPEKLLKKDIMHCIKCKTSVHTKGRKVDQKIVDDFYGVKHKKDSRVKTGSFSEYRARFVREGQLKKLQKENDLAKAA